MSLDNRYVNPTTGGFESAAGGAWKQGDALANKILFSLKNRRGSWPGDPQLGNRFHELERSPDGPGTRQRLSDLVQDSMQWLIDGGELDRVVTTIERIGRNRLGFESLCYPPGRAPIPAGPFEVQVGT